MSATVQMHKSKSAQSDSLASLAVVKDEMVALKNTTAIEEDGVRTDDRPADKRSCDNNIGTVGTVPHSPQQTRSKDTTSTTSTIEVGAVGVVAAADSQDCQSAQVLVAAADSVCTEGTTAAQDGGGGEANDGRGSIINTVTEGVSTVAGGAVYGVSTVAGGAAYGVSAGAETVAGTAGSRVRARSSF